MWRTRCVLALVVLYVGLAQSWDIAVTKGDVVEFYADGIMTDSLSSDSQDLNITVLVYDEIHDMLLFVIKESVGDYICSYGISSKEKMVHVEANGRNIHGLAFDPATELLFFSDTNERSINWISLKRGSNNNIYGNLLTKTGDAIPTDVAVDSCRGYVYWINTNLAVPTIEKAAFNGSEREYVFTFSGLSPHSLVINQLTKKIYFIEPQNSSLDYIWYSDLNGDNLTFLESLSSGNNYTGRISSNSLTVSNTFLYWVDYCSDCEQLVWQLPFGTSSNSTYSYANFSLGTNSVIQGIVANYKIKENYQYIQDCEPLTNLVQNNSDEPSCIHGQSVCKCTPGYSGERCNVPVY